MKRISLDQRLCGHSLASQNTAMLARMPVNEFFDYLVASTGHCSRTKERVVGRMAELGLPPSTPICDVIGKILDEHNPDPIIYGLIIEPYYWIHRKEIENHG